MAAAFAEDKDAPDASLAMGEADAPGDGSTNGEPEGCFRADFPAWLAVKLTLKLN